MENELRDREPYRPRDHNDSDGVREQTQSDNNASRDENTTPDTNCLQNGNESDRIDQQDDLDTKGGTVKVTSFMIYRTICLYMTFLGLGWCASILGTTLVNMEVLYNTETKIIALTMSLGSLGYMAGSFLCGVVFDRFNSEIQFSVACVLMGIFTLFSPWIPYLYGFMMLMMFGAAAGGFIDAGGNSYGLTLWHGHKWKGAVVQASHMLWSVGSTTGPLIIKPFLSEINNGNATLSNFTFNLQNFTSSDENITTVAENITVDTVRYAYILLGCLVILTGGFYMVAFFVGDVTCRKHKRIAEDENEKTNNRPKVHRYFTLTVLGMLLLFYVLYDHVEGIPGNFIASFAVKHLGWTVDSSSVLVSLYWGSIGFGRVVGIPLSLFVTPTRMILTNLTITSSGLILMCFINFLPHYFMYISTAIAGFGMSTTFPSGLVWLSHWIAATGKVTAVILVVACVGNFFTLAYTAYIFQSMSYMVVIFLPLVASLLMILVFIAMVLFTSWYQRTHPYITKPNQQFDKNVDLSAKPDNLETELSPVSS